MIRHSPCEEVIFELRYNEVVHKFINFCRRFLQYPASLLMAACRQKLGKRHWIHIYELNTAHRKWNVSRRKIQQRACGDNMQPGSFFIKISQCHECSGTGLYFIQKQQELVPGKKNETESQKHLTSDRPSVTLQTNWSEYNPSSRIIYLLKTRGLIWHRFPNSKPSGKDRSSKPR